MGRLTQFLNPFWSRFFQSSSRFALLLVLLWGLPRFAVVLSANVTGNYSWVSLIFLTMWITPWLFLSKPGRQKMGLKAPTQYRYLPLGFAAGVLLCTLMYGIALLLFGEGVHNWFVYISKSYSNLPDNLNASDKRIYFAIYAVIGMTFSPIGEELFYRGLVHEAFAIEWQDGRASTFDSLAFALTHLAHFGILYINGQWQLAGLPALVWMALLFLSCKAFYYFRKKSGTILGAVLTHAGFNLAMTYLIFYGIL